MSSITDMVIYANSCERAAMERLNQWCVDNDPERQQAFAQLDTDTAGGAKVFCSAIWAMAGNYVVAGDLAAAFPTFGWIDPESAVLIYQHQQELAPTIVRALTDEQLTKAQDEHAGWGRR